MLPLNPPCFRPCMAAPDVDAPVPQPGPKPPGAFRVLHSADWHLGKLLAEVLPAEVAEQTLGCIREARTTGPTITSKGDS